MDGENFLTDTWMARNYDSVDAGGIEIALKSDILCSNL